jgi:hypothetical protein
VSEHQLELLDAIVKAVEDALGADITGDEIRAEIDDTISTYEQETP